MYNEGNQQGGGCAGHCDGAEIITKRGHSLRFGDTRLGQGAARTPKSSSTRITSSGQIEDRFAPARFQPEALILNGDGASEEDEPLDDQELAEEESAAKGAWKGPWKGSSKGSERS